jgi:hypothetical protein
MNVRTYEYIHMGISSVCFVDFFNLQKFSVFIRRRVCARTSSSMLTDLPYLNAIDLRSLREGSGYFGKLTYYIFEYYL